MNNREWQCAYCGLWVPIKSPRHAHFAPDDKGAWIKTVYTRELSNALRANPQQEDNER